VAHGAPGHPPPALGGDSVTARRPHCAAGGMVRRGGTGAQRTATRLSRETSALVCFGSCSTPTSVVPPRQSALRRARSSGGCDGAHTAPATAPNGHNDASPNPIYASSPQCGCRFHIVGCSSVTLSSTAARCRPTSRPPSSAGRLSNGAAPPGLGLSAGARRGHAPGMHRQRDCVAIAAACKAAP